MTNRPRHVAGHGLAVLAGLFPIQRSLRLITLLVLAMFAAACGDGDTNGVGTGGGGAGGAIGGGGGEGGEGGTGGEVGVGGEGGTAGMGPSITDAASFTITPENETLVRGESVQLEAAVFNAAGDEIDLSNITVNDIPVVAPTAAWTSSDTDVATVDPLTGEVTAVGAGTATITLTVTGTVNGVTRTFTATALVTVVLPELESVSIDPVDEEIGYGEDVAYTLTAHYVDDSEDDVTADATWTSSEEDVATIDEDGDAAAEGSGTTEITGTYQGESATTELTVAEPQLTEIRVMPAVESVAEGLAVTYAAEGTYEDGSTPDITDLVDWSSDDAGIADFAGNGSEVATYDLGSVTITASLDGVDGEASLTVTDAVVVRIEVAPTSVLVARGLTTEFTATAIYSNGDEEPVTADAAWSTGNADVATVDPNTGIATGENVGLTTITASFNDLEGTASISVTNASLVGVQIDGPESIIAAGTEATYTLTALYSDSTFVDVTSAAVWSSSNVTAATIVSNGVVRGEAASAGVDISASFGQCGTPLATCTDTTTLVVTDAEVEDVVISGNATILIGGSHAFTATGLLTDGTSQILTNDANLTWNSTATNIADIGDDGVATSENGGSAGATDITATYDAPGSSFGPLTSDLSVLTVSGTSVVSIALSPESITGLPVGIQDEFELIATLSDNTTLNVTESATWSSNGAAATVSNVAGMKGIVTGAAVGTTTVTAEFVSGSFNEQATGDVTVSGAVVQSLLLTPSGTVAIPNGTSQTFIVMATFTDGLPAQDVSNNPGLSFSAGNILNVTGRPSVLATAEGTTTLTASFQGITSNAVTVNVTDAILLSLEIDNPADDISLAVGQQRQFNVIGHFSDNTSVPNFTSSVSWRSSNNEKARVSNTAPNQGLLEALEPGFANVTAQATNALNQLITSNAVGVEVTAEATVNVVRLYQGGTQLEGPEGEEVLRCAGTPISSWHTNRFGEIPLCAEGCTVDGECSALSDTGSWDVVDAELGDDISNVILSAALGATSTARASIPTTGLPQGIAQVRVRDGNSSVYATLEVTITDTVLEDITVSCEETTCLPVGRDVTCTAMGSFSDGSTDEIFGDESWSTSNGDVAFFENSSVGTVTTDGVGSASVRFCTDVDGPGPSSAQICSDDEGTDPVLDVQEMQVTSITVSPANQTVNAGQSVQYSATGSFTKRVPSGGICAGAYMYDITDYVTWTPAQNDEPSVSVDSSGFAQTFDDGVPTAVSIIATLTNTPNGQQQPVVGATLLTINDACFTSVSIAAYDVQGNALAVNSTFPSNTLVELRAFGSGTDTESVEFSSEDFQSSPFSDNVQLIDGNWYLDIGTTSPGLVTFTTSQGSCSGALNVSATPSVTTQTVPDLVYIQSLANESGSPEQQANVTIPQSTSTEFIAVALYGGYHFNVSADSKSTWSNNPELTGLSSAETAGSGGLSRTYTHVGQISGPNSTLITATHKNEAAPQATLIISGRQVASVEINTVVVVGATPVQVNEGNPGIPAFLPIEVSTTLHYVDGGTEVNSSCVELAGDNGSLVSDFGSDNGRYDFDGQARRAETLDDGNNANNVVTITARTSDECELGDFSDTFALTVNSATLASITFGQGGPFLTLPRGTTTNVTGIQGLWSNLQAFTVTNWVGVDESAGGEPTAASVSLDSSNPATGVTVTSGASAAAELVNFTFPSTQTSIYAGVDFETNYQITVTGECYQSVDLFVRTSAQNDTSTNLGSVIQGFNIEVQAFGTNSEGVFDLTQTGTWSAPGFTTVGPVTLGNPGLVFQRFRSTGSTPTGAQPISLSISGASVCEGGVLGDTSLTQEETVNVSAATPQDLEIRVVPTPESEFTVDTWHLPLGQSVAVRVYAIYSAGPAVDVTQFAVLSQVNSGMEGPDADLTFPCEADVLEDDGCSDGFGVVIANADGDGVVGSVGLQATWNTFDDSLDFVVEDCGDPLLTMSGSVTNLPVGNERSFTASVDYDGACETLGEGDPDGQGAEALVYDVTRFSDFDGSPVQAGTGVITFIDGSANGSVSSPGLGTGDTVGNAQPSASYARAYFDGDDDVTSEVTGSTASVEVVDLILNSLAINWAGVPLNTVPETFLGTVGTLELDVVAVYRDGDNNLYDGLEPPDLSGIFNQNIVPNTALTITRDDPRTGGDPENDPSRYYAEAQTVPVINNGRAQVDLRALAGQVLISSNVLAVDIRDNCIQDIQVRFSDLDGLSRVTGSHSVFGAGVPFQVSARCFDGDGIELEDEGACTAAATFAGSGTAFDDVFGTFPTSLDARVALGAALNETLTITATLTEEDGACLSDRVGTAVVTVNGATLDRIDLDPRGTAPVDDPYTPVLMALDSTRVLTSTGIWNGVSYPITLLAALESTTETTVTVSGNGSGEIYADESQQGTSVIRSSYAGVTSNDSYIQVSGIEPVSIEVSAAPNLVGGPDDSATMPGENFRLQLFATVTFSDGSMETFAPSNSASALNWTVATAVPGATVHVNSGLVTTGIGTVAAQDTFVVRATYTGTNVDDNPVNEANEVVTATFPVFIVNSEPVSIEITGPREDFDAPDGDVALGSGASFEAIMTLAVDAQDQYVVTDQISWFSTDEAIGTVAINTGGPTSFQASFENQGATTVTAIHFASDTAGEHIVTVGAKEHVSYVCRPTVVNMTIIDKAQLRVFETFTDLSEDDLTDAPFTVLESLNPGIAVLDPSDPKGVVTGVNPGTTSVVPTVSDVAGEGCTINVAGNNPG